MLFHHGVEQRLQQADVQLLLAYAARMPALPCDPGDPERPHLKSSASAPDGDMHLSSDQQQQQAGSTDHVQRSRSEPATGAKQRLPQKDTLTDSQRQTLAHVQVFLGSDVFWWGLWGSSGNGGAAAVFLFCCMQQAAAAADRLCERATGGKQWLPQKDTLTESQRQTLAHVQVGAGQQRAH
jgi:hypothetical protein